jgi:type III secretion protein V
MTAAARLQRMLARAALRSDIVVATLILVAVTMMIIPLPTEIVDALITANIAASVIVLLVAFYVSRPLDFSSLPTVILLATLFRLAITITTTRLILLQADAGEIIHAFGSFVIGGNLAVGLVVFLIITIAQFVVITKGAERVAEVSARFSLDALPGKQMSIDSDLRNGDIDQAEARRQRQGLERESQLYGAMDGAMKFVKGDAIAGLVIIVVNLAGGLLVGSIQHGMPLGEAAATYSLLTVGDGLIAQIPALLVSIAAGTVVTRVGSDGDGNLGAEITSQLLGKPRVLALAAATMLGLAAVPGFPTLAFLALAAALAGGAYVRHRAATTARQWADAADPADGRAPVSDGGPSEAARAAPAPRITVAVGRALAEAIPQARFRESVEAVRRDLVADLGVEVPDVELRIDEAMKDSRCRIDLEGVPVADGEIEADHLLVEEDAAHLDLMSVPRRDGRALFGRGRAAWVARRHEAVLAEAGIGFHAPPEALARCLAATLRRYAAHFLGIQETRALLARMEADYAELVAEAQKAVPLQRIAEILRALVEEDVPIRNLRLILEALVECGQRDLDAGLAAERVRAALRRQISFRHADPNRVIAAYVLERSVEDALGRSIRQTAMGSFLTLAEETWRPIVQEIERLVAAADPDVAPVVLTTTDVRRHVRALLARNGVDLPVLAYQELAPEFSVHSLATIGSRPAVGALGASATAGRVQAEAGG